MTDPRPRDTVAVRLYLPATLRLLIQADGLHPTTAHAVTPELAAVFPEEDEEGLEFAALLAAADDAVALLAEDVTAPRRRVVVVADVAGETPRRTEGLPSAVVPPAVVPWLAVVSLHVDEGEAEADVAAALDGDGEALERAAERDLLWFDVSELDLVRRL
jgi:hypothetical protein